MTTYYARVDYSYSGDSKFTIPFSYIKKEHIVVLVNDVKTTNYTYITSSQIEVKDGLQAEDVVSIRRTTPIKDKLVSFTDLNILNGETQNLAQEQVFNAVQEMYDDNTQFKIDTENNILQNRTEIDAQIEANNQELLNIQSSFESEVNTTIETVKEAAEKINNLEQAVGEAKAAAQTATSKADETSQTLDEATTSMNQKLANATEQAELAAQKAQEIVELNPTKTDLSNLTEAGEKHFLNKSQITNCLLEVPQRIKLELNNGTLTLKTGSQVIKPNGFEADGTTPKFDYITIETDIIQSNFTGTQEVLLCINPGTNQFAYYPKTLSGNTAPTETYTLWYDTTNNLVKATNTTSDIVFVGASLPFAKLTISNSILTSINQVFNGMGYIGSTVWVDKGVKGLIPDGRNEDGSLNNIEFTTDKVLTLTLANNIENTCVLQFSSTKISFIVDSNYIESDSEPTNISGWTVWFNTKDNINYLKNIGAEGASWKKQDNCNNQVKFTTNSSGIITSFTPKQPFRAVDYNDFEEQLANKQDKCIHIIETYQNGASWYRVWSDGWCEQGGINTTINESSGIIALLKSYINTNYHTYISVYRDTYNAYSTSFYEKSVNSFRLYGIAPCTYYWQTSGYIR